MIEITEQQAEDLLELISKYWDECYYQIDNLPESDTEELPLWKDDLAKRQEVYGWLANKIP